jgi:hypothetical protein
MSETLSEQNKTETKSLVEREQFWHDHYKRWQKSGLSLAGYARSKGLVVNTFYGWHDRLKKRGLAKPEPAPTVFQRVTVKPTVTPVVIEDAGISLHFRLPNGIDCVIGDINLGNCRNLLESLAHIRL